MRLKAIAALAIILAVNFGGWYLLNRPVTQRSWDGYIASVSFTPYQADQGPHDKKYPSVDQIDRWVQSRRDTGRAQPPGDPERKENR